MMMDANDQSTLIDPEATIGYVVSGGLKENLHVRLTIPAQQVQEGGFVILESGNWRFYGLVTDLQLGATDHIANGGLRIKKRRLLVGVHHD